MTQHNIFFSTGYGLSGLDLSKYVG